MVVSSAYTRNLHLLLAFFKSLMQIEKNNGPNIDPWGTPHVMSVISEFIYLFIYLFYLHHTHNNGIHLHELYKQ